MALSRMASDPIELLRLQPSLPLSHVKCPPKVYYELNQLLLEFTVSFGAWKANEISADDLRKILLRLFSKDFCYSPQGVGIKEKFIGINDYLDRWIFSPNQPISGDIALLFHLHQPLLMLSYDDDKKEAVGRAKIIFGQRKDGILLQFLEDVVIKFKKEKTWKMCVMLNKISDLRHKL